MADGWHSELCGFYEAIRRDDLQFVHELVSRSADRGALSALLESRDLVGNTPLIFATAHGAGKVVKYLVKCGVDMNASNRCGNTCLHFANEFRRVKMAAYLQRKGGVASAQAVNSLGFAPAQRPSPSTLAVTVCTQHGMQDSHSSNASGLRHDDGCLKDNHIARRMGGIVVEV